MSRTTRPASTVVTVADRKFAELDALLFQPLGVRPTIGHVVLQLFVVDDASLFEVDQEHLAGLQPSLVEYPLRLNG